jgi:hypothetical protein
LAEEQKLDISSPLNPLLSKTNIPCLYLAAPESVVQEQTVGSSKILVYFHANAEDIGLSYHLLDTIRTNMKINVLAPEYPGYGIYRSLRSKNGGTGDIYCSN